MNRTHSKIKIDNQFCSVRKFRMLTLLFFTFISQITANAQSDTLEKIKIHNEDSLKVQAIKTKQANIEAATKAHFQHFVLKNEDGTFGYAIFVDGNMTYHQPNIPALIGTKGFAQVDHAGAAAKLAIQKIKEGESPPTLSVEEVDKIINGK
jgi:hypothetical protein